MNRVQSAVFPGAVFGSFIVALIAFLVTANLSPAALIQSQAILAQAAPASPAAAVNSDQPQADAANPSVAADCPVSAAFPENVRQWCSLIAKYAQENQLDPNLIAAVILQESGGNPQAYSKSGAVGLMQVMPRDGIAASFTCNGQPCFGSRPTIGELQDPEYNIAYGTRMLAGLVGKYGDVREALKSYGPINVGYYYADIVLNLLQKYQ